MRKPFTVLLQIIAIAGAFSIMLTTVMVHGQHLDLAVAQNNVGSTVAVLGGILFALAVFGQIAFDHYVEKIGNADFWKVLAFAFAIVLIGVANLVVTFGVFDTVILAGVGTAAIVFVFRQTGVPLLSNSPLKSFGALFLPIAGLMLVVSKVELGTFRNGGFSLLIFGIASFLSFVLNSPKQMDRSAVA